MSIPFTTFELILLKRPLDVKLLQDENYHTAKLTLIMKFETEYLINKNVKRIVPHYRHFAYFDCVKRGNFEQQGKFLHLFVMKYDKKTFNYEIAERILASNKTDEL